MSEQITLAPEIKAVRDDVMSAITEYKSYLGKQLDELKANGVAAPETKEAIDKVTARLDSLEASFRRPSEAVGTVSQTVGALFTSSDEFKTFTGRGWHKGGVAMKFKGLLEEKTLIDSTTIGSSTSGILTPQRVPGLVTLGLRELRMRNLLATFQTTKNAIEFVKENVFTNNASPQADGGAKGESALTFTIDNAPVRTIAHWIPASRQVLDDFAELMSYIDFRLMYGLKHREDYEILLGDGLGVHLSGLVTEATAYAGTYFAASDTKIDMLRHAILEVNAGTQEFPVDGIVLHPANWQEIELIKTEEGGANKGQYIMGGPANTAAPTIWGKPVVVTTAMPLGKFLVGSFQLGAALFDRMDAVIDVSTENEDYFIKNKVAIRAEERVAMPVYRPSAFRYGTF